MYTIKHAAERVGVSVATLRAWERRYGVGAPRRTDAGYRLYDEEAIAALGLMKTLVEQGWTLGAAAEEVRHREPVGPEHPPVATPADIEGTPDGDSLDAAAAALDPVAARRVLDEQFSRASFETVVDDWLLPALHQVGTGWETGRISVAGEHLIAAAVMRRLAAAYDAAGDHPGSPRIILGLPPGARHELGLLAFATAARRAGLATSYLGADVPAEDWAVALRAGRAAAVVLAVPMSTDAPALAATMEMLRATAPEALAAVGGSAQDLAPPECLRLGHRIGPAALALAARLGVTGSARS